MSNTGISPAAGKLLLDIIKANPYCTLNEIGAAVLATPGHDKIIGFSAVSTAMTVLVRVGCVMRERDPKEVTADGKTKGSAPFRYVYVKDYHGERIPKGRRQPADPPSPAPAPAYIPPPVVKARKSRVPTINLPGVEQPIPIDQARQIYDHLKLLFGAT